MDLTGDILEVLHMMRQHQTAEAQEVTVLRVLDVDGAPGIPPAPHLLATGIIDQDIAANHCKGDQTVLTLVNREVVNIDAVILKLLQNLECGFDTMGCRFKG